MSILDTLAAARGFTETDRAIASYILTHADDVVHMKLAKLAQESLSSNAAVVRLCKKVGVAGYNEFRIELSRDIERRRTSIRSIDANAPILEGQQAPAIMSSIATLGKEALDDCYASVSQAAIAQAAEIIADAHNVITYAVGDAFLTSESFANYMIKIGVTCISAHRNGDVVTVSNMAQPDDVGLFVTYSGRLVQNLKAQVDVLRERGCKTVVITANEELARRSAGFGCAVIVPGREKNTGYDKIATFYSQTCLRYALECIYGTVFAMNYQKNLLRRNSAEYYG